MTNQNNHSGKESYDVVIIGAGAAGVGCGVVLKDLGVKRFAILDRHDVGASFRRWPAETRLLTPSFTINGFGMLDLNSIALQTSPAYTLNTEHPTGSEYALYLNAIANYFDLPVQTGVNVEEVTPYADNTGFTLTTSQGEMHTRFIIWAAGEFQYPNQNPFPGAELCRHYATISSWEELELAVDEAVVIGGYESGIDSAINLANEGIQVYVLDPDKRWDEAEPDPSLALSPYTKDRLHEANRNGLISFIPAAVMKVEVDDDEYCVHLANGEMLRTGQPPILATGFRGSLSKISHLFEWSEHGSPIVSEEADESTITPGLFLSGPMLRHGNVIFCFIYKFRQRFAIVGNAIAEELGLDTEVAVERYRQGQMYLDDLTCCAVECAC
ncbi:MAG: NAD(P)/FAD-dependent oxidoreductase [Chloroflexota bacterium]